MTTILCYNRSDNIRFFHIFYRSKHNRHIFICFVFGHLLAQKSPLPNHIPAFLSCPCRFLLQLRDNMTRRSSINMKPQIIRMGKIYQLHIFFRTTSHQKSDGRLYFVNVYTMRFHIFYKELT